MDSLSRLIYPALPSLSTNSNLISNGGINVITGFN